MTVIVSDTSKSKTKPKISKGLHRICCIFRLLPLSKLITCTA
jgi:hypothetical protein